MLVKKTQHRLPGNVVYYERRGESPAKAKGWIIKWHKIDNETGDEKISVAVHSCTSPVTREDRFSFVIDLGTATEDALTDLFEILSDSGTTVAIIQTTEI
ncbi:MAG: hypothetical protein ABIU77_13325 [Ferruginibacter sp.]|jgi:hypothetical protein